MLVFSYSASFEESCEAKAANNDPSISKPWFLPTYATAIIVLRANDDSAVVSDTVDMFFFNLMKKHFLYPDSDGEDLGRQKTEGQLLGGRTKWQQYWFLLETANINQKRVISGILWFDFWTKVY